MLNKPLAGVRVIEVSMWAFVPSAGAVLADWGAEVVKIEAPTGDPIRGLTFGGVGAAEGLAWTFELFNRGKRAMSLDLTIPQAQDVLHELVKDADVFLCSLLPAAREKLRIDAATIREINPSIVYAAGSGTGPKGPDAGKGGYDSISFWSRGSVSASVTPADMAPLGMPSGAFGDSLSGMSLAGGIVAALLHKERTGEGSVVDVALLGTAMWSMQMAIVGAAVAGLEEMPKAQPGMVANPLVNNYQTSDGRYIALCMLQPDAYWDPFTRHIGRADLAEDPRFSTGPERAQHGAEAVSELAKTFAEKTLDEWKPILRGQRGQWDVVNKVGDLLRDEQAIENGFVQRVKYDNGGELPLISSPVLFDGQAPELVPAPGFAADTDAVLQELGWDEERILESKISGAVI